jgi:hypothetical protein
MEEFLLSIKEFNRLENLELYLNFNLLASLPAFAINNSINNRYSIKMMKFECSYNKIVQVEEFVLSLKDFKRLENLELIFNYNKINKLPAFNLNYL